MANQEGQELVLDYCETQNDSLRDRILVAYQPLIEGIARKFSYNRSDLDDLIQIASMALISSLSRFDPSKEVAFSTFVTPNIIGEIKHYFRDKNRLVKVPRKLQETNSKIRTFIRNFEQKNQGMSPTVQEISQAMDITEEDVLESMEANLSTQALSLDSTYTMQNSGTDKTPTLIDQISTEGSEESQLNKEMLEKILEILPEKEYQAIKLRFYSGMSQIEIANRLNLSQMHISRLLKKALAKLNTHLTKE